MADKVDIMFVGRALNGWTWNFPVPTKDSNLDDLLNRIKRNVHENDTPLPEREQLGWVDERNADHPDYNSKRSQFWQTIREVMEVRKKAEEKWWHGIVWTNFQPLSRDGANPTSRMVSVMGDATMNLLLAQIEEYQPRYIVCLSGMNYAAYLLARATRTERQAGTEESEYVEYAGVADFPGAEGVGLVIMPHPQGRGKKRAVMVEEILKHLI
ncbi:hypothetical protein [Neolewinella antarctica]|uniref:Uracil-DNA glycosylase-like domain-containing protein n=1 Tax=Neolewinella antarctica TaxID=442734 RepID=A0ABX0XCY5_9BACT|nr:hypothetical protein [Neolewinella antarctica]NJC27159.1 hypothetical protein [Neolewinella antarctica]